MWIVGYNPGLELAPLSHLAYCNNVFKHFPDISWLNETQKAQRTQLL